MSSILLFLILFFSTLSLFFLCVYLFVIYRYNYYWKNKNVPGPEPVFPMGNMKDIFMKKVHMSTQFQTLYEETKKHPCVGVFAFHRPSLMINDLDMVKTILVKDFSYFTDHTLSYNKKAEPLAGHLFNMKGSHWKDVRSKLSPAFTSSKMKYMFDTMAECGHVLKKVLETDAIINSEIDIKDLIAKYTTDIIVSCAMGIESDSLTNKDAQFRKIGEKVMSFNIRKGFVMVINSFMPKLMEYLPLAFIDDDVSDFFINAITNVIQYREKNRIERNDLMQLLIRLKNNESIEDNEDISKRVHDDINLQILDIAAEAFGFFVAGFETSSTATSCLLYELSVNPDIQNKLRKEIIDTLEKHDGKITYEALVEMTYMTQTIEESLRKYPPIPLISRLSTKDYTLPNTNTVIEKGTRVVISVLGIHKDPDIYENPEKFDPERFSSEKKINRHHFSFLPFGEGPRICIGMRFALMQIKIALVSILCNYEVLNIDKNKDGIQFDRKSIFLSPEGLKLRVKKI